MLLESYQCLTVLPSHSDIFAAAVLTPPYWKSIHHDHCSYFFLICKHTIPKISTESYQNNLRQSIFYESNDLTALFYIDVVYCRRKPLRHGTFSRNAPTSNLKYCESAYMPQGWKAPHCGALWADRGENARGPLSCTFIEQANSQSKSSPVSRESGAKRRLESTWGRDATRSPKAAPSGLHRLIRRGCGGGYHYPRRTLCTVETLDGQRAGGRTLPFYALCPSSAGTN